MSKKNEAFENLYERGKKLFERLNKPSLFENNLKDSIIIANLEKENNLNNNIKSYDTIEKAELLEYSLKQNGSNSKINNTISNLDSSLNGSKREGFVNSEGKYMKIDISQYKSLVLKYGKINFNNVYMNNSFVNNNDILYLESKIPIFKANNEIMYDTLKNYHQQGSDKEDKNNLVNINQSNTHKINLDENSFASIAGSKIFIFLHKIIQGNFRKKANGSKKDISSAQNTEVIQNSDIIIGYSSLEMNKIFLSEDLKYTNKINIFEKKKIAKNKKVEKSGKKNEKNQKEKKEYEEIGERIIGTLEISCILKRPYQKIFNEEENKLILSLDKNDDKKKEEIVPKVENISVKKSPVIKKEFIIDEPLIRQNEKINNEDKGIFEDNYYQEEEDIKNEGNQKIRTDINGDILILYLKVNELKVPFGNDNLIQNINNINEQIDNNKNIIVYNYGPQAIKRNYFLRHKIFPDNKNASSEINWNKSSPDFNYNIQMPFTLNQKTVELLDNGKFVIEIWNKCENNDECLGIISFDLRNILDSLKVDDKTITTLQLYKNTLPYIIYDDYYQIEPISDAQDLSSIYLKVCLGIGTPSQINNLNNFFKKNENKNYNILNGINKINKEENKIDDNDNKEKNNISLNPFKEPEIKENQNGEINNEINNISKAADINVFEKLEKNHNKILEKNISRENSVYQNQKENIKSESFEENSIKKKIMNPFYVPQEEENKIENGDLNLLNSNMFQEKNNEKDENNEVNRYNQKIEKKNEYIDIKEKEENIDIKNDNMNERENNINYMNYKFNESNNNVLEESKKDYNKISNKEENKSVSSNHDNEQIEDDYKEKEDKFYQKEDKFYRKEDKFYQKEDKVYQKEEDKNEKKEIIFKTNIDENRNNNDYHKNEEIIKDNLPHVKKHIFTISIDKIIDCQIISKLPPTYLRYQFFTDQKPLRSELFNYSQFSIYSSEIDVDMKSVHSIILPKVKNIKDYLNDFLVELLYDINTNNKKMKNNVIIGRVNIPSDEFKSLIKESNDKKFINELTRYLFIYGTEKIQRNKCIIGKLKLNFKYTCVDVPISQNNIFNGSLSTSNNGLLNSINNNLVTNFGGSIYLEKETIFNRKIPKNACLKINVENFNSTSLFEDYYLNQFSISFLFSIFGEVLSMENTHGKRATSKKHNMLNCEFNEILSYKLEIQQDIIDYFKCRSGIVYLVYKTSYDKKEEENEEINSMIDLNNLGSNKRIIGKGHFSLNEILTSAEPTYKEISISQIGNGSMSLGILNISLSLENDKIIPEEIENIPKSKKGLSNKTSDLYKIHNKMFNKCEPIFYLNGQFLLVIDFRKIYYEINSDIGNLISSSNNFYFVFKLGNKIKKISPQFNKENNEIFSLNQTCNLMILNYMEKISLNLNFNKKIPHDIYNLFNEGIFEVKLYQNENSNSLGSFYIDLHKLVTSELFSENLLYSGNNVINFINVKNNSYKNCKLELNISLFKINEIELNNIIMNKINHLAKDNNDNNIINNDTSLSNLDYYEYYQYLFSEDYSKHIIKNSFKDTITNINNESSTEQENILNSDWLKLLFNFNSTDMFTFINNSIINLVDNKGLINVNNFKKIFNLITKLEYDTFEQYKINSTKNPNYFDKSKFDYYLNNNIINVDNEDDNVIKYLRNRHNIIDIGINNYTILNDKNNKTIKKLLINNFDYELNEDNDYIDVVALCLFYFDYYYYYNFLTNNLHNFFNVKSQKNIFSKTQPLIYKKEPDYFNRTINNINSLLLNKNQEKESKIMVVSILSGHNIIIKDSEFNIRPNCYFVLEFDDKNYTSEVIMNSSQPNFNEELEIKINADEYAQKLNTLLIYITIFSFIDENTSVLIGRCEINPSNLFPFLNENNECEDFFHIKGDNGEVMGQLDIKFKFDDEYLNNISRKRIINNSFSMTSGENIIQKNNNTISYPLNQGIVNNNKNKMKLTYNENDDLYKKLNDVLNDMDTYTNYLNNKILPPKIENKKMSPNLSDIKSEEMMNSKKEEKYNQFDAGEEEGEENLEEMEENYEENYNENEKNGIEQNEEEGNEEENKIIKKENNDKSALTEANNMNNSQKLSINDEDKASFYSETKEKQNGKMKYLKNYDKNILNKIQKIMKNQNK